MKINAVMSCTWVHVLVAEFDVIFHQTKTLHIISRGWEGGFAHARLLASHGLWAGVFASHLVVSERANS